MIDTDEVAGYVVDGELYCPACSPSNEGAPLYAHLGSEGRCATCGEDILAPAQKALYELRRKAHMADMALMWNLAVEACHRFVQSSNPTLAAEMRAVLWKKD